MRKQTLLLLLCAMLFAVSARAAWDGTVASAYAGGDGSKANPYQISNANELAKLAEDVKAGNNWSRGKYFVLTADIVINENLLGNTTSALEGQTAGKLFNPIGTFSSYDSYVPFMGVFDGQGHTISGMYQAIFVANDALFAAVEDAVIKNVCVKDSYIYGGKYCAGIVSFGVNSQIRNCSFEGTIKSWEWYAAGIAGQLLGDSKIQNCYTQCNINAKNFLGGIIGIVGKENDAATVTHNTLIENCYAMATMVSQTGGGLNKGMIAGRINAGAVLRNCYYKYISDYFKAIQQNSGTAENVTGLSQDELYSEAFVTTLNTNAEKIAGACRWKKTETTPVLDFSQYTEEEETVDVNDQATDPIPSNGNKHAENTAGELTLHWTAPASGKAEAYNIYVGKDAENLVMVAEAHKDTNYSYKTDSYTDVYYWRIDCVDSSGNVMKGNVWLFQPAHLAFPGAEGYGRYAQGGRGGKVVYVTNLNDEGEGSLRWAMTNESGPRTIMFKVSGLIDMNHIAAFVDENVTIAGQTAPGKGICLAHCDIAVGSDNIFRFIRARRGAGETGNAMGVAGADHAIVDHVTASWGTDETFSSRNSKNVTFQRSIISEALGIAGHKNYGEGTNHGYAATIGGDIGSFHHNLLANCNGRNWSMGGGADASGAYAGRLDVFNNVVYNWGSRTTDGGAHEVNFVGNYYKVGTAMETSKLMTLQIEGNLAGTQSVYVAGNVRDNMNGTLTQDKLNDTYNLQILDGRGSLSWEPFVDKPFFPSYAKIETAVEAYKSVLSDVGAGLPVTDATDARIINETLTRTYTYTGSKSGIKGQIDDEADAGGYEAYPEEAYGDDFDTDLDGLPNWWEDICGTNVNSPADDFTDSNADADGDGFTALEDYLDFMAQPNYVVAADETVTVNVADLFKGYTKSPSYAVTACNDKLQAAISGGTLTVKPTADKFIGELTVKVTDGDGHSYERRICFGVNTAVVSAIEGVDVETADLKAFEIYSTAGQLVKNGSCAATDTYETLNLGGVKPGIYVMKTTDVNGKTKSYKIIKR